MLGVGKIDNSWLHHYLSRDTIEAGKAVMNSALGKIHVQQNTCLNDTQQFSAFPRLQLFELQLNIPGLVLRS